MKGVTKTPKAAPDGRDVVSIVCAPIHHKYFAIVEKKRVDSLHTFYTVEALNRSGKFAKRQVKELSDRDFSTQGIAKHEIRMWDIA